VRLKARARQDEMRYAVSLDETNIEALGCQQLCGPPFGKGKLMLSPPIRIL